MINVVNEFGRSFKGLSGYLLRGPNNDNPERVDWTMTHNLGTDDANLAWRIMADTSRRADELKKAAGFGAGGRKSKGPVLHYVLSWKPEEAETLTKEEMQQAALDSLKVLGKQRSKRRNMKTQSGDEHQVLIVAHKDKGHCHVHLMVSRTHPEHGLSLPSYKDFIRLSDWAHEYRKEMGLEHLTPERVKNYEARKRSRKHPVPGVKVKGKPRIPRHIFELQSTPVNDNTIHEQNKAYHKQRDRRLTKLTQGIKQSQAKDRKTLDRVYLDGVQDIHRNTRKAIALGNTRIHTDFDRKWAQQSAEHDAELKHHQKQERTWLGRKKNSLSSLASIDFRSLIKGDGKEQVLTDVFSVFTKPGASLELLKRKLTKEAVELKGLENRARALSKAKQLKIESNAMAKNRRQYLDKRAVLFGEHRQQKSKLKALWAKQRKARVSDFARNFKANPGPSIDRDFKRVSSEPISVKEPFNKAAPPPPSKTTSTSGDDERQKQIDAVQKKLKESREDRKRGRKPRNHRPRR